MAIITPSSTISEISGSIGNETYSRNHYRNYVRAKTNPVQPDSAPQIAARDFMGIAAVSWRDLNDDQRNAWNQYANEENSKPRLSSQKKLTGFNAFVKQYIMAARGICAYPAEPSPPQPPIFSVNSYLNLDVTGAFIQWDIGYSPPNYGWQFWASGPVSSGIMSPNSVTFKVILESLNNTQQPTIFFQSTWEAIYGLDMADYVGFKIFAKLRLVVETTAHSTWSPVAPSIIF